MKKLLLFISIVFIFASCDINGDPYTAIKPTKEDSLIYKVEGNCLVQKYYTGEYFIFGYSAFPACTNDNEFTLKKNGIFTEPEGATKCNPSDPDMADSGTWSVKYYNTNKSYSKYDSLVLNSTTLGHVKASFDKLTVDSMVSSFKLDPAVLAAYGLPAGTIIVFKAKSH